MAAHAIEQDKVDASLGDNVTGPLSSEHATRSDKAWTLTSKPEPESSLDCLIRAKLARRQLVVTPNIRRVTPNIR